MGDRDEHGGRPAAPGPAREPAPGTTPASSQVGVPSDPTVALTTRSRSETYVARRSWAVVVAGLRAFLQRAYEARWTLRVISVTAAAAGATWAVCLPFGGFAPAFGAASAVYAVQLTVRTSVLDGAKRTVLMGLSVFLAVVILRIVGLSALAVMVLVFVSLAAGQLLRLGASGSLQIPGTAIFILALGTSVSTSTLLDRVWATLVGAVIGAAASYVAYPGDPRSRARRCPCGARQFDRGAALGNERRGGADAYRDRDGRVAGPRVRWRTSSSTHAPWSTRRWPSFAWTPSVARRHRSSCRTRLLLSNIRWLSYVR